MTAVASTATTAACTSPNGLRFDHNNKYSPNPVKTDVISPNSDKKFQNSQNTQNKSNVQKSQNSNRFSQNQDDRPTKLANSDREKHEISQITDFLFLSGCQPVCGENLINLGINCAINCIKGISHELPESIKYITIPLEDEPSARLSVYIQPVVETIHQNRLAGGRTLVYCGMGISRSASLCIAYLLTYEHLNLRQAYEWVQKRRTIICPNVGFFRQLLDYEFRLTGSKTVKIIEAAPSVFVADVVWEEIQDEVRQKMHEKQQQQQQQQQQS